MSRKISFGDQIFIQNPPAIYPGAVEFCNGVDDNCDYTIDENCDVSGIGDDVAESNPGAVITIDDENVDGILEEGDIDDSVKDSATDALHILVSVAEFLSKTAIDEAIAAGADAKEMAKTQDEISKGKYDKAIDHYQKPCHVL